MPRFIGVHQMDHRFVLRHKVDGTLFETRADTLNNAKRASRDFDSFEPWECWDGSECLWHYTESGDCVGGKRPVDVSTGQVDGHNPLYQRGFADGQKAANAALVAKIEWQDRKLAVLLDERKRLHASLDSIAAALKSARTYLGNDATDDSPEARATRHDIDSALAKGTL